MSQHPQQPTVGSSPLQRILQKLGYACTGSTADDSEDQVLSRLTAEAREYLQLAPTHKWPPRPDPKAVQGVAGWSELKTVLGRALVQSDLQKAVAVVMLWDSSPAGPVESSLFDDVMHFVADQGGVLPPQLLLSWAKGLQIKGDLHGAIRTLNTAKTMLTEHKESFPCPCEAEKIRGECLQLAGLTLNKMCCWKSAVQPLTESTDIFRKGAASEERAEATLVSVDMAARCLCNVTHGDFLELRDQLGFRHHDRFYQAYTMCKESASLASPSHMLFIKVQNQAAESLLKYAAQEEDPSTRTQHLQTVLQEAQRSLQGHASMEDLAGREQFFELVRSLFLINMALNFSASNRDRLFASKLEEQARLLYAEYCKQLSEKDFLCDKIDPEACPEMSTWLRGLSEVFGLNLDLQSLTTGTGAERSTELGRGGEGLMWESSSYEKKETSEQKSQESGKQAKVEDRNEEHTSPSHRQEVGLPINPEDYAIPVYDVPLTIFQDLCGCKFTGEQAQQRELASQGTEDRSSDQSAEAMLSQNGGGPMLGITEDSGYESSAGLVDTILTTKLPDTEMSRNSDHDSGIHSSCSSADSDTPATSDDCAVARVQRPAHTDLVKKARLLKFNPVTGLWSSQTTLVYVGHALQLEDRLKGNCREALHVQFLHQDEVLGRYVGKRYRRQRPPGQYLQDVTCQKTARFLVTLFNYALQDLRYDIQVVYVPVAHVQILSRDGEEMEDWLNVEPYLEGDFIKLTNNLKFCNSQGRTLATALTHFTHSVSDGQLMLVDLQGWLPREGRGVVYLTDPQFHTSASSSSCSSSAPLSSCDMGARGMQAFWESVHPTCNAICRALGLKRPEELGGAQEATAATGVGEVKG